MPGGEKPLPVSADPAQDNCDVAPLADRSGGLLFEVLDIARLSSFRHNRNDGSRHDLDNSFIS